MRLIKLATFCLLAAFITSCGPTIYKASNFEDSRSKIKTLAILPFDVSMEGKRLPKGTTVESLQEYQENTGYEIQDKAYAWLLQRQDKYTVTFQDISRTNALLKKANLQYEDIFGEDKGEIAKLLGVDAVITGKAVMSRPMSEGAAIAVGVLVGAWGSTNNTQTSLNIHDAAGSLLWKYDYEAGGSIGSSPGSLTNALMKNASKKFPYKS